MSESSKNIEYTECHNHIRQMYDNRMKVFNFAIVFNVALMVIVFQHLEKSPNLKPIISCFGLVATTLFALQERRYVKVYDNHVAYAIKLGKELGLGLSKEVFQSFAQDKLRLRLYYLILYALMALFWIVVTYNLFTQ